MASKKKITAEIEEYNQSPEGAEVEETVEDEAGEEQPAFGVTASKVKYYNLKKKTQKTEAYDPKGTEKDVLSFMLDRIPVLKKTKQNILDGTNFEDIMRNADREYQPRLHLVQKQDGNGTNRVYLIQDEIKGLRGSRVVPVEGVEGEDWRSNTSEPTLFVKTQTALSIIIDRNPQAVFKGMNELYKARTDLAKAMWRRSWNLAGSKKQFKLFVFDLAKYGWAVGRTYPRVEEREGYVLDSVDIDDPEKNTYKKKKTVKFNDVYREKLNPYRTWIDDNSNPVDEFSTKDWYFEKDYTEDDFCREFDDLKNFSKVLFNGVTMSEEGSVSDVNDANEETKQRKDMVTLGFYENEAKDLYVIWVPGQKIVLYFSPLPNDDKMLSLWHTMWTLRDPRTPYGIGLYEIIKNNKLMFDRFQNMTMDQLILAIYPMIFYSGSNQNIGDDELVVSPGRMKQKMPGTDIDQVKIDFDQRGPDMLDYLDRKMDENTGITKTLQGEIANNATLGETLHAKDSALKRMNIPLSNICEALTQDAYISLSWMKQIYSLPDIREFVDARTMAEFEIESGMTAQDYELDEETGRISGDYYRTLELGVENRDGVLAESGEDAFMTVGQDFDISELDWRGTITIEPQSIVAGSPELDRQLKVEMYNLIGEKLMLISEKIQLGDMMGAQSIYKPIEQVLEISNENPENWIPKEVLDILEGRVPPPTPLPTGEDGQPLSPADAEAAKGLVVPQAGDEGSFETVVPRDQVSNPVRDSAEAIQG